MCCAVVWFLLCTAVAAAAVVAADSVIFRQLLIDLCCLSLRFYGGILPSCTRREKHGLRGFVTMSVFVCTYVRVTPKPVVLSRGASRTFPLYGEDGIESFKKDERCGS